jgi:hypothetical protein
VRSEREERASARSVREECACVRVGGAAGCRRCSQWRGLRRPPSPACVRACMREVQRACVHGAGCVGAGCVRELQQQKAQGCKRRSSEVQLRSQVEARGAGAAAKPPPACPPTGSGAAPEALRVKAEALGEARAVRALNHGAQARHHRVHLRQLDGAGVKGQGACCMGVGGAGQSLKTKSLVAGPRRA